MSFDFSENIVRETPRKYCYPKSNVISSCFWSQNTILLGGSSRQFGKMEFSTIVMHMTIIERSLLIIIVYLKCVSQNKLQNAYDLESVKLRSRHSCSEDLIYIFFWSRGKSKRNKEVFFCVKKSESIGVQKLYVEKRVVEFSKI